MRIVLIEPYYGGSHKAWADALKRYSSHDIRFLTLPAQFWKWRMQGGAVTLARMYADYVREHGEPDLILCTDMMNVATFKALTQTRVPLALFFHENQLSYPQNSRQHHGWRYGFVNYISALTADRVYFSSPYHHDVFFEYLPRMLNHFADYNELESIDVIRAKSSVLPLAVDLKRFDKHQVARDENDASLIVWNHRWEEDKNPTAFFSALDDLMARGIVFRVAILGDPNRQNVGDFEAARERLGARVVHYGYAPDFATYARWLWRGGYVVSTANQEFFGISIAEAMYCGCVPILPRRLNYPNLVPEAVHDVCLYPEGKLSVLLGHHLTGKLGQSVDSVALQAHIVAHDWSGLIAVYDRTFADALRK